MPLIRRRGWFNLHTAGIHFIQNTANGAKELETPTMVRLQCSERDYMDWRRTFSIELGTFEMNRDSIFQPK